MVITRNSYAEIRWAIVGLRNSIFFYLGWLLQNDIEDFICPGREKMTIGPINATGKGTFGKLWGGPISPNRAK